MNSTIKLAIKVLARRKFFTFISLFGISMTLLVLMLVAAAFDNVFLPRAPESKFDRAMILLVVGEYGPESSRTSMSSARFIDTFVRPLSGLERVSAFSPMQSQPIYVGPNRVEALTKRADAEYWNVLDFRFAEGRPFTPEENAGGSRVAVVSDSVREKLLGSGPAVGKTVLLDGKNYTVVGVVNRPSSSRYAAYSEIWIPLGPAPRTGDLRWTGELNAIALAKNASDIPRIQREFATRVKTAPVSDKDFREVRAGLDRPFEAFARLLTNNRAGDRAPMIVRSVIAVAALLFMTLPALNLITLNLSRILERSSEIGVRKAFGAPRWALIRQLITENVVLTVIGGLIGFLLSIAAIFWFNAADLIPDTRFDLNLRIFAVGMGITIFFGILSGFYPAWRMSRLDPVNALRGGAQ